MYSILFSLWYEHFLYSIWLFVITFDLSNQQLLEAVENGGECLGIPDIPCHSQNNERAVQDVTIVAKSCSTYEKRLANLKVTLESREKISRDSTKLDWMKK